MNTVELPDDLVRAVKDRADLSGEAFGDVAIRLLRKALRAEQPETGADPRLMKRRYELTEMLLSGELGVDLEGFEETRAKDRARATDDAKAWSDE